VGPLRRIKRGLDRASSHSAEKAVLTAGIDTTERTVSPQRLGNLKKQLAKVLPLNHADEFAVLPYVQTVGVNVPGYHSPTFTR